MAYVKGIDLNRYRGTADFKKIQDQGYEFCVARVTVGNYYTDPLWQSYYEGCLAIGMPWSGYHVVVPTNTVSSQMDRFNTAISGITPEIPWTADCEVINSQLPATVNSCVRQCIPLFPKVRGFNPLIYTNYNYGKNYLFSTYGCELWIADPDPQLQPDVPPLWNAWRFRQYSWSGQIEGVATPPVDLDYGNFQTIEELKIYYKVVPPPLTLEERVTNLESQVNDLNNRVTALESKP